jgi:Leucine-rich repeat (LRR) protein
MEDITEYLNSLSNTRTQICISRRNLTKLPDLSRFKNLKYLACSSNKLTSLPPLNDNLEHLNCSDNQLTSLPDMNSLQILNCSDNNLISLPPLNDNFKHLNCSNNKLTALPPLNHNLISLNCSNNPLTSIPNLHDKLTYLCGGDCVIIREVIGSISIDNKQKINKWNHFRYFYFLSKLRKKIISWMWKSREKIIREQFHPRHLDDFLKNNNVSEDDDKSLNMFLDNWIS